MRARAEAVISLDVGGTTVDAACVSSSGELVGELLETTSPSHGSATEIVNGIAETISKVQRAAGRYSIRACGIGMPGPFHYEEGISVMEHKFEAIKGLRLGQLLEERTNLPMYFVNDAVAFGLGVSWKQLPGSERLTALTIGTGLGASFIERGESVEVDPRVPEDGEIWNLPHGEGILEDVVSGRGIRQLYQVKSGIRLDAKTVADRARLNDSCAVETYQEAGRTLGRALLPIVVSFQPEKIVVGGKIGRSLDLFGPTVEQELGRTESEEPFVVQAMEGNMAIYGAAKHAFSRS